ncbi:Trk system potassium uptake protein TrkA [Nymphon striatum]|nr:Trk system potassium uptake protein TrkA [Nymphon striatum]
MRILICGAGQVGYGIAERLSAEDNDVTVIDNSAELVQNIQDRLDVRGYVGHGSHPDVLARAGADSADMIIAVTLTTGKGSIQICLPVITCRLDVIISPEIEVGDVILRRIALPGARDVVLFNEDTVAMVAIECDENCPLVDTPLSQLSELFPDLNAVVAGISRKGKMITPRSSDQILMHDIAYVIADRKQIRRTISIFGKEQPEASRIVIAGGGNIGVYLARRIEERLPSARVKIIENSRSAAERLADQLNRTVVLHGNALDESVLQEAGADNADLMVAITNNDQVNILSSVLAKKVGSEIVEAEALEASPLVGKPLRELELPAGIRIGMIFHDGKLVRPTGDSIIRPNDRVVILALSEHVHDVEQMGHQDRSREARLEEAVGLARAISLEVVDAGVIPIRTIKPSTLFGSGKVDEITGIIKSSEIGLAIIDHPISPKQQQNLEEAWHCKVLDRTGLILEIFGARAQTKEGTLQVELAHLNYQKGRLVRTWTHLERQRGALGFVGGPGETQIEADRRLIQERINKLERDLAKVKKTRDLHRSKRKKVPHPVVALVGYTNAGKSTLFNLLTGANVMAKDLLFATLDPTLRQLNLPQGTRVILSDTVGFVSNLPTHLVAAFRATLEEVIEAELILHVRDIAHEDYRCSKQRRLFLDQVNKAIEPFYEEFGIDKIPEAVPTHFPFGDELADAVLKTNPNIKPETWKPRELMQLLHKVGKLVVTMDIISKDKTAAIGTMALVPQLVDAVKLPVIAAGGIADGRGIAACLALGAAGAQIGTAFLTCEESSVPQVHQDSLMSSDGSNTSLTKVFSGRPARGIQNRYMEALENIEDDLPDFPLMNTLSGPIRKSSADSQSPDFVAQWSGQAVGLNRKTNVSDLIENLVTIIATLSSSLVSYEAHASIDDQFMCDAIGDGNYVITISSSDSKTAEAVYSLGLDSPSIGDGAEPVVLVAEILDEGFKYTGEGVEFIGSGNQAFLVDTKAKVVVKCTASAQASQAPKTINKPGFSLGGKIRSGPGTDYPQIGSVFGTKPITILDDTGVLMNGYSWFKIKLDNGDTGYQWGGILCSAGEPIKGVYERCE